MKVIEEWAGRKWVAGLMLSVLIVSMANGFVPPAFADETPIDSTPATSPETTAAAPETSSDTSSSPEQTPSDSAPASEQTQSSQSSDSTPPVTEPTPQGENGSAGETGTNGDVQDTPLPDGQPSEISTGNASSDATSQTSANTTSVDTTSASSTPASTEENAPASNENSGSGSSNGTGSTTVGLDNGLTASTTASSTAATGDNSAVDPDGVNIFTGDGISSVFDVLTFNIALVNSTGRIVLMKNPLAGELDLRDRITSVFKELTGEAGTCTLTVCEVTDALFNYIGDNIGEVERNTYAGCNSGHNIGEAENGPVLIDAGNCKSSNLTVTIGDLTAIHSRYLIILMNKVGNLDGDIVLPEASFFEGLRTGGGLGANSSLNAGNTADVTNNGTSTASSGDNTATGTESASVDTGGALAHAFTGTFANQINPPSCFIISVGGTWNGDVYQIPQGFDREHTPYADIICGRGKASGDLLSNYHLSQTNYAKVLVNAIAEATTGGNVGSGKNVTITSGDAQSFLYVLNILNTTLIGQDWLFGLFTVSGDWNGDFTFGPRPHASPAEQAAGQMLSGSSGPTARMSQKAVVESKITLTKTASQSVITSPAIVEYTLTLKNNGKNIYGAKLQDLLTNPLGTGIGVQTWDLGTIKAGEEIVIKYSIEFKGNLVPGTYTNSARLTGREGSDTGVSIKPVRANSAIELLDGEILGMNDCPAYLTSYIVPGRANDSEQVRLLEIFLKDTQGENIEPDGTYDATSVAAVERFQKKYSDQILSPWGMKDPTGYVYYTTKKTINEIVCGGEKEFPLSSLQMRDILAYRNGKVQPSLSTTATTGTWSAAGLPLIAQVGAVWHQVGGSAPVSTPSMFSYFNLPVFPILTLLRDMWSSIAQGFSIEHVQAAVK